MAKKIFTDESLATFIDETKLYIDNAISDKGSNEQTQPDWNQNDSTKLDYIKNRTHWVSEGTNVVVPSTTEQHILTEKASINFETEPEYDYDKTYLVTVNGVEYRCVPYELSDDWGSTYFSLGDSRLFERLNENDELVPDNTHPEEVPFLVQAWFEDNGSDGMTFYHHWSFSYPASGTYTVEVAELTGEVEYHTLDERYLPDTVMNTVNPTGSGEMSIDGNALFTGSVEASSVKIGDATLSYDSENSRVVITFN